MPNKQGYQYIMAHISKFVFRKGIDTGLIPTPHILIRYYIVERDAYVDIPGNTAGSTHASRHKSPASRTTYGQPDMRARHK
jgi:hypothetical protein